MALPPKDMEAFMAEAAGIFPSLNVRNTFLHCEEPGVVHPCRSLSCPPPRVDRLDRAPLGPFTLQSSSQRRFHDVSSRSQAVVAAASATACCGGSASSSPSGSGPPPMTNSRSKTTISKEKAPTVVARGGPPPYAPVVARGGPPPYAPPVVKVARQEKRGPDDSGVAEVSELQTSSTMKPIEGVEAAADSMLAFSLQDDNSCHDTANVDDEWAVVGSKRKKKPQLRNGTDEHPGNVATLARSQQSFQHQLEIGIEDDAGFQVIKRLIGPSGNHMDRIRGGCLATKVELRGVGTKSLVDDSGPLVLHIRGDDSSQCADALERARQLVVEIQQEHKSYMAKSSTGDVVDSHEESTSADTSADAISMASDSDSIANGDSIECASKASSEQKQTKTERGRGATPHVRSSHVAKSEGTPRTPRTGRPIHHEVPVGIKHSSQFPIVKKVIGPGGENIKNISSACPGTKLELRGAGTNPWNGGETGPLMLHIRGHDETQCEAALKLANELIDSVRKDHQKFLDLQACR